MQLFTEVKVPHFPFHLSHHHPISAFGSCFTEHLSAKLQYYKFKLMANPFGISYNPWSIYTSIQEILHQKTYTTQDLQFYQGLYHTWQHHGSFAHPQAELCLQRINQQIQQAYSYLTAGQILFITWGTAYVFKHHQTGVVVNNCHKYPSATFQQHWLDVETIFTQYRRLLADLWAHNPGLQVVLTVSPVRHWRDGLVENNRSKATLLLAAHKLVDLYDQVHYFPAYELIIDELRDYRFYASDLVHPSAQAVDYVWEKFVQASMDEETIKINQDINNIRRAKDHRPLHPGTAAHQDFLRQMLKKVILLAGQYPDLNWQEELAYFKSAWEECGG